MGMSLRISAIVAVAALTVLAVAPAADAQTVGQSSRVHRGGVVPYDSNMSMIDRMARRNMERRHIERRMRLAPPRPVAPRRPGNSHRR
jgi:hypothetical protein